MLFVKNEGLPPLFFGANGIDIYNGCRYNIFMIQSFRTTGTEDIFDGSVSQSARKCCPQSMWPVARRKLDQINRVREINELSVPPGKRLERLKGDRENQYSIRSNQQYRICFTWEEGNAYEIEITDYH